MPSAIVECVPNFSEGRNKSIIDALSGSISANADVRLLDIDQGPDANRTVLYFHRLAECRRTRGARRGQDRL